MSLFKTQIIILKIFFLNYARAATPCFSNIHRHMQTLFFQTIILNRRLQKYFYKT